MIYLENEISHKEAYIIPIGDLHFGDEAFQKKSYEKLKGYIQWVGERQNARVVLGGDIFNVATRASKTSPFNQRISATSEMDEVVSLLEPIKSKIAGAIDGNHEARLQDYMDISLIQVLCSRLNVPYMGMSGVINFKVNKKKPNAGGMWNENYYGYFHHSTGGGSTIGGALNRTEKLQNIVEGCDFYCSFHSHKLSHAKMLIYKANPRSKKVEERSIDYVTCGGYLSYKDSYAEQGMMRPTKLGSPRIRLDGNRHDVHISI